MTMRGTAHPAKSTIKHGLAFSVTVQLDASGDQTGSLTQEDKVASSLTHVSTGKYKLLLVDQWFGGARQVVVTVIKATSPNAVPFYYGTPSTDTYGSAPGLCIGFTDTSANLADPVSCYLQFSGILKQASG